MNIEQTILGAMLLEPNIIEIVLGLVKREMFYEDKNVLLFDSIMECRKANLHIDTVTITKKLHSAKQLDYVGGSLYIMQLINNIPTSTIAHIESHCRILIQEYIRRQMFVYFNNSLTELQDAQNDIFDIYNSISNNLENLFDVHNNGISRIDEVMSDRINQIEQIDSTKILGITTGHKELNEITSGWQPGDFIILAARPSMGKTAISLLFATSPVLTSDEPGLFFSLEMPKERLSDRIISYETHINSENIQANRLNQSERIAIYETIDKYSKANLYINDESGITIEQISAIAIKLDRKLKSKNKAKKGLKYVIIDYLQLIKFSLKDNKNTNEQIGHITKKIKSLAKKLSIPVIALSQLNRNVEQRSGEKRPGLSDLRDSGNIEQDADIIMFLYRPEYYGFIEDGNGNLVKNIIELIIAKHRNGRIGYTYFYKNDNWSYLSDKPYEIFEGENIPNF